MSLSYDPVLKVTELQCFRGSCLLENDLGSEILFDEQKNHDYHAIAAPETDRDVQDRDSGVRRLTRGCVWRGGHTHT
jgi:hypothetical protein